MNNEQLFQKVEPALRSKVEELRMYKLNQVTEKDVWNVCQMLFWETKKLDKLPIHQIVRDIMKVSSADVETYTSDLLQGDYVKPTHPHLNDEELAVLLAPQNPSQ